MRIRVESTSWDIALHRASSALGRKPPWYHANDRTIILEVDTADFDKLKMTPGIETERVVTYDGEGVPVPEGILGRDIYTD